MVSSSLAFGLVVDDHPLVARGTTEFLRAHPLLADAEHAPDLPGALAVIARRGPPAIALIDFWLGSETAAALASRLLADHPGLRVLVMSGDDEAAVTAQARALGAHGFVHKSRPPDAFEAAVTALLNGGTWFASAEAVPASPSAAGGIVVTPAQLGLTGRQGEVLALLLRGLPNKRIAQRLALSESTVKEHVSAVLSRRGARTRAELIAGFNGQRLKLPREP